MQKDAVDDKLEHEALDGCGEDNTVDEESCNEKENNLKELYRCKFFNHRCLPPFQNSAKTGSNRDKRRKEK